MTNVIAKGSAMRQDAVNKAKAFDEKHQLRANASARINSFDKRVGLSEKINNGISVVNEKVKSVDQTTKDCMFLIKQWLLCWLQSAS